VKFSYRFGL